MNVKSPQISKVIIIILLQVFILLPAFAQQEVELIKLDEPLVGFDLAGHLSVFHTPLLNTKAATPRVIVRQTIDGIFIKANYTLYRFGLDYTQHWKKELSKNFKLGDTPSMEIASSEGITYVFEIKKSPAKSQKVSITKIDLQGNTEQAYFEIPVNTGMRYSVLSMKGNLYILNQSLDHKKKKLVSSIYRIDKTTMKLTTKVLGLPTADNEYKKASTYPTGLRYSWYFVGDDGENLILIRRYLEDTEEKKKKRLIIEVAEVDDMGNVSRSRELFFQPALADEGRKFILPTIAYTAADNSLTVTGFMEIDRKKINGLYLLKYDHSTGALIYKHEHHFKDILKPEIKSPFKAHYNIPENVNYSLVIPDEDLKIDLANGFIDLRIVTHYNLNSFTFFEVKFDQYGDHVETNITTYRHDIGYFKNIIPNPWEHAHIWRDKIRPHVINRKPTGWDYINSKKRDKDVNVYWVPVSTKNGNSAIRFDQNKGTFTAFKLNDIKVANLE